MSGGNIPEGTVNEKYPALDFSARLATSNKHRSISCKASAEREYTVGYVQSTARLSWD